MKKSLDRELSLDAGFTALELVVVVVAILLLALVVVFI
ncbi:MAG: prepilin-type N-terminal cleavage/methylation domain-containing protein [Candidatus Saccharimonadaceae bacterium]